MDKLSKVEKENLVEKILEDCRTQGDNYSEFMLDCVKETTLQWDDDDLISWFGDAEVIRSEIKEV